MFVFLTNFHFPGGIIRPSGHRDNLAAPWWSSPIESQQCPPVANGRRPLRTAQIWCRRHQLRASIVQPWSQDHCLRREFRGHISTAGVVAVQTHRQQSRERRKKVATCCGSHNCRSLRGEVSQNHHTRGQVGEQQSGFRSGHRTSIDGYSWYHQQVQPCIGSTFVPLCRKWQAVPMQSCLAQQSLLGRGYRLQVAFWTQICHTSTPQQFLAIQSRRLLNGFAHVDTSSRCSRLFSG